MVDQGDGHAAFDGVDTVPGQAGLGWNAAQRDTVPAAHIGTGSTLVVRAKATLAGGIGANMVVRVGGTVIGSATVSNTTAYADYSFPIPGAGGGTPGAVSTGWSYDANNLPVAIVQKAGGLETGRWTLGYSGSGDVVSIADVAGGSSANLSNDAAGRITQVVANNGATASFSANARGQMVQAVTPGGTVNYLYDARNLPTEIRFSDGRWVRYAYNSAHRLTEITDSTGKIERVAALQTGSLLDQRVAQTLKTWLYVNSKGFGDMFVRKAYAQTLPAALFPASLFGGGVGLGAKIAVVGNAGNQCCDSNILDRTRNWSQRVSQLLVSSVGVQVLPNSTIPLELPYCKVASLDQREAKSYCMNFCLYELDFPGRTDNFGPFRACIRRCMDRFGFTI